MSDEDRERLIDDFWNEVGEGLDVPPGFVERLRAMRPNLPEDPTATRLEAWIELADQVRGEEFRGAVRSYLQDAYGAFPGRSLATAPVWDFVHEEGQRIGQQIRREPSEEDARYAATHGRYLSLVGLINETPTSAGEDEPEFFAWVATALLASVQ